MAADKREADTNLRWAWGILLLAACLFVALSLFSYDWKDISLRKAPPNTPAVNLVGPVGAWVSFILFTALGIGAYLVPVLCLAFGLMLLLSRAERIWPRAAWCAVLMLAMVSILELDRGAWASACQRLNIVPDTGGLFGRLLMRSLLVKWLSPVGAGILMWSALLLSFILLVEMENIMRIGRNALNVAQTLLYRYRKYWEERRDPRQAIEKEQVSIRRKIDDEERRVRVRAEREAPARPQEKEAVQRIQPADEEPARAPAQKKPAAPRPTPTPTPVEVSVGSRIIQYNLPSLALLQPVPPSEDRGIQADSTLTGRILVETLNDFGILGEVTNIERGPVVTRYEFSPAPGIRIEKISSLSNNLALSLKATSLRVQAPVPGKGVVGIEVPNTTANKVYVREILEGDEWRSGKARLPLILGKDVGGNDLVADLADMPHVLIAGATGAGKTVCMNSILAGLLMARTPNEMRLLLVDPKIVEFASYNHLPHLVVPVITNPKKVALGLRWAINEMEKRYKLFAKVGVRNIEGYNHRQITKQAEMFDALAEPPKPENEPPPRIPYIVIVIDELADLMLADQAEIENCVARLAALSRAVGIHMILSTQRPSVNVITGTIKANFPARIAFQVAQKTDSRTILDTIGAEKLLGRGDMLFLPPGSSKAIRAQGAMITDADIKAITDHIRNQTTPAYEVEIHEKLEKAEAVKSDDGVDEELVEQCVRIIRETHRASTSSLQRRLRIGYTRAARIMDILEERGILGPPRGAEPREILIDLDGDIPDNEAQGEESV